MSASLYSEVMTRCPFELKAFHEGKLSYAEVAVFRKKFAITRALSLHGYPESTEFGKGGVKHYITSRDQCIHLIDMAVSINTARG